MEWRDQCDSTIRVATQILSRGEPKLGDELASQSQAVLLGKQTPQGAATLLEEELKAWYAPHQGNKAKGAACQCEAPAASSDPLATAPVIDETLTTAPAQTSVPVQAEGSAATVAEAAPLPAASPQTEAALAQQLEGAQ
jgi:raffinose/stachyose/melibiose transport system substrate-binding protein